jgi:hypothetical protein
VEHIGFEPMTSSMPWKRASQLRQCPELPQYSKNPPVLPEADLLGCYAPTLGHVHVLVMFVLLYARGTPLKRTSLSIIMRPQMSNYKAYASNGA